MCDICSLKITSVLLNNFKQTGQKTRRFKDIFSQKFQENRPTNGKRCSIKSSYWESLTHLLSVNTKEKKCGRTPLETRFVRSAVHGTTCHTAHKQQLIKKLPVPSTSSRMLQGTLELFVPAESLHEEVKLLFHCVVYHQKNDKFIWLLASLF